MSAFGVTREQAGATLDLTSPAQSSELSELEARLRVLSGLLDASERLDELNKVIRYSNDRPGALSALQHEPFGYSRDQAEAVLDMPMSWQTLGELARLRAEHDLLAQRRAAIRQQVAEVVAHHWFG
jgi:DNA gyrase/topoisomerase IV subunit A